MAGIFPMNAKAAKDKFNDLMDDDNYIAQEKLDGVRTLIRITSQGKVYVTTRGEAVDNPGIPIDITHRIPMLIDWDPPAELLGSIIDCEAMIEGLDSAQTAGVLSYKSTVPIPEGLKFYAFDVLAAHRCLIYERTQAGRLEVLCELAVNFPEWIVRVPHFTGKWEKEMLLRQIWSEGKEGIMLKNLLAKYQVGKRPSNAWYKVKKVDSVDAKIVGAAPPEVFYRDPKTGELDEERVTKPYAQGWFGALVYELEDGTSGTVAGLDDEEKQKMSDGHHGLKPEYLGRYVELKFMEKTKLGKLRHPRFIRLRDPIEK